MSRSWRSVTPALVQAVARSPIVTDREGYRYVVQPNGEKLEQCETHAGDSQHRLARSADYVVGTGHTWSVRQLCEIAFAHCNLDYHDYVVQDERFFRPAEVDLLVADAAKARTRLGWEPKVSFQQLVARMVDAEA